ncbi:MAG: DUF1684 domain-containing protein [Bacteroidetes bacterium]|nr:DUF1684 domain-containing protein [Bacteroidota bacterium]
MNKLIILFLVGTLMSKAMCAQSAYEEEVELFRKKYLNDLLTEPRQPIKPEQAAALRFFLPDENFKIYAEILLLDNTDTIYFTTVTGVLKTYTKYALAEFFIDTIACQLTIYQSPALKIKQGLENYLFLPFNDLTNGNETYEVGRYIDFTIEELAEEMLIIDFNKAYNPYCAYSDGFACPIPPKENMLNASINAGEKKPNLKRH